MADEAVYGSLPFSEQIEYFSRKLNLPTNGWTDIYTKEHDWAFVVAGANRDDILTGFRQAVEKAIAGGSTLADFRKDFDKIVEATGWQYNGGRNWRSRVIYETNLRQSYNAGREAQIQLEKKFRPYLRYNHNDSAHPRPQHQAWDGLILPVDDPFWSTHMPANGWGCKCSVETLAQRDMEREGLSVGKAPPVQWEDRTIGQRSPQGPRTVRVPKGIDPGFEYAPGRARLISAIPPEHPAFSGSTGSFGFPNFLPKDSLPTPRTMSKDLLLPSGLTEGEYLKHYLGAFGIDGDEGIYKDVMGESIALGMKQFETAAGASKLTKRDRERFLLLLAAALKSPDEIWVRLEWHNKDKKSVIRRRYVAQYLIEGETKPMLAVFERAKDGWFGVTTYQSSVDQVNAWRVGIRLYKRP